MIAVSTGVLLGGCFLPHAWVKSDADAEDYKRASAECSEWAREERQRALTPSELRSGSTTLLAMRTSPWDDCMRSKGWRLESFGGR